MVSVEISGIKLKNPVLLASGIMDEQGDSMVKAAKNGAGGVVTKSIGKEERNGYKNPVVIEIDTGIINAIGLANPGIDNFKDEIKKVKENGIPVIGSIFGNKDDFTLLAKKMEEYGVDAVELNLSCPHVKGFGSEIGQDPELVEEIINEIKRKVNIPIFAKLTPNITNIIEIAMSASKADALVLINTVKAISIDIYAKRPILSNYVGGYSGPGIKPIGLRAVYDVRKEMDIPIIGVGGINNWKDAVEYILAGAKAVQVGTAIYYYGFSVFRKINEGIEKYMEKEGFNTIDEFSGLAVK
ncbi:MAG: dihydroorotate dehydrogenase [Thermoplasmata archaeon]|nr:dihydroorotate dehydrogenase [Thermoplasmata archaeon]